MNFRNHTANFVLTVVVSLGAKAQSSEPAATVLSARQMSVGEGGNRQMYTGDVKMNAGRLLITQADTVIVLKDTKTLLVRGTCNFSFDGTIVSAAGNKDNKGLTYTLGEATLFIGNKGN